jgi:hypothetical protein
MVTETERWLCVRERQLAAHPLCQYCLERLIITRATTCDHRDGALVSLCEECDTVTARMLAMRGYRTDIGLHGWPLDRKHPVYMMMTKK